VISIINSPQLNTKDATGAWQVDELHSMRRLLSCRVFRPACSCAAPLQQAGCVILGCSAHARTPQHHALLCRPIQTLHEQASEISHDRHAMTAVVQQEGGVAGCIRALNAHLQTELLCSTTCRTTRCAS
jgi:hypothetical protein